MLLFGGVWSVLSWTSVFFFLVVCFFFFWSVTSDEEQADWTLLASAVPSTRLKDDLYSRFQVSPSFVFNITKYKQ